MMKKTIKFAHTSSIANMIIFIQQHGARLLYSLLAFFLFNSLAQALEPISDDEMSEIYGQGLITLSETRSVNYASNNITFTRVNIPGEIRLQASIDSLKLGYYDDTSLGYSNGVGWDIDLTGFELGQGQDVRADQGLYLELAYKDYGGTEAGRELIGIRIGFPHMQGNIGLGGINAISGRMNIENIALGPLGLPIPVEINGHRDTTVDLIGFLPISLALLEPLLTGIGLRDTSDFWLSSVRQNLQWEYLNPGGHTDFAGFNLHAADNLDAAALF